jgi:glycosyltransferase involved in cell wall biosynthesis
VKVYLDTSYHGWILDAIVKESAPFAKSNIRIIYVATAHRLKIKTIWLNRVIVSTPISPGDLVINQNTLLWLFEKGLLRDGLIDTLSVFFTHEDKTGQQVDAKIVLLGKVRRVIVMNSHDKQWLVDKSISETKIVVAYGAIDRKVYFPQQSDSFSNPQFIYISGDAKPRKNPDGIMQAIRENPDLQFVINGRGWKEFISTNSYSKYPNLKVMEFNFSKNPRLMRLASVYLTLSHLEGGPYPVLEALASGTPVVATATGWNTEFINRSNGRIVGINEKPDDLRRKLEACLALKKDVFHRDLIAGQCTWTNFASRLYGE